MTISFDLPEHVEKSLRESFEDLNLAAKEAAMVELYRQHKLTLHELGQSLGLSRLEADEVLKQHNVNYEFSADEIRRESESLRPAKSA